MQKELGCVVSSRYEDPKKEFYPSPSFLSSPQTPPNKRKVKWHKIMDQKKKL
jgi:hypothetical protein